MKDLQGSPSEAPAFTGRVLNLARLQHPTVHPPAIHPFSLRKERFTFYLSLYSPVIRLTLNHLILTHKTLFGDDILAPNNFNQCYGSNAYKGHLLEQKWR